MREFNYLGVLFSSEGTMEREMGRRSGTGVGFALPHWESLTRRRSSRSTGSIFVPALTSGHEGWVMTERTRSRKQADEMGFLRRLAGISLRDRVRGLVIREELGVEPLLLYVERSQLR